jgi:hypothetical protein
MPFWVEELKNVHSSEEEDAEFVCKAGGLPRPDIKWSINGVPAEELQPEEPSHEKGFPTAISHPATPKLFSAMPPTSTGTSLQTLTSKYSVSTLCNKL